MKKVIAILLIALFAISVFPITILATATPTVTVGVAEGEAGDKVSVKVTAENLACVGITAALSYDEEALEFVKATAGKDLSTGWELASSFCWIGGSDNPVANEDISGEILVLTFNILSGAAEGDYDIELLPIEDSFAVDADEKDVEVQLVKGKITVNASAAPVVNPETRDVKMNVVINEISTVYSVNVAFGAFTFTYAGTRGAWLPATHSYDGDTGEWTDTKAYGITVTNHSNAGIGASVAFDSTGVANGTATVGFKKAAANVATAFGTVPANAPATTFKGTVGGDPANECTDAKIGTITVTISEPLDLQVD